MRAVNIEVPGDQYDICKRCGFVRLLHRIGDDACPEIIEGWTGEILDFSAHTFQKDEYDRV